MNIIENIRVEEVIDENPLRGRVNLPSVRKVVYTCRVFSQSTGMWYNREGNILVGVGYRSFRGDPNMAEITKMPVSNKHLYQADMVIMTRFTCDTFTVLKNRWGIDGGRYSRGLDLGYFLVGHGLDAFDMDSRELLWENILEALHQVTDHPIDYIKDKERFMLGYKLKPRYVKTEFEFK